MFDSLCQGERLPGAIRPNDENWGQRDRHRCGDCQYCLLLLGIQSRVQLFIPLPKVSGEKENLSGGRRGAILSNRFIFLLCTKDRCNAKIRNGLRHMGLTVFNDIYALLLLINDLKKKSKVARSKKKSSCDNKELQVSTCS